MTVVVPGHLNEFDFFFHHSLLICVSLISFANEEKDPFVDRIYICNLYLHQN